MQGNKEGNIPTFNLFFSYNYFDIHTDTKVYRIVNISDATARFNVSVKDQKFDVISGLIHEKYIDAKAVPIWK